MRGMNPKLFPHESTKPNLIFDCFYMTQSYARIKCNVSRSLAVVSLCVCFLSPVYSFAAAQESEFSSKHASNETSALVDEALGFLKSQIGSSGMIDSFVEDGIPYSYTYDNALAAMAFISSGEIASARGILDAYLKVGPDSSGGVWHRYDSETGLPSGGILRVGHNAYLLQAMNLYFNETGDARYNDFARDLGYYLISNQDVDGGLRGSYRETWKSTENNCGAFSALYNLGILQDMPNFTNVATCIHD